MEINNKMEYAGRGREERRELRKEEKRKRRKIQQKRRKTKRKRSRTWEEKKWKEAGKQMKRPTT